MSHNYRALVHYDPAAEAFVARAPELPECRAHGATRAEAIAALDAEIEAQVSTIIDQGGEPPLPVDEDGSADGNLAVKVSAGLHRELLFRSRVDDVSLDQLVGELLSRGLSGRADRARGGNRRRGRDRGDNRGNERGNERDDRRGNRGGGRYQQIMDDKASFLEYVRGLDAKDGNSRGGRGRGRRGRGARRDERRGDAVSGSGGSEGSDEQ